MPTEKPRVTFTISQEKLDKVDAYRFDNKFKNQTQAILSLIEKGLADLEQKETSPFSSEAMQLAQDYDTKLDAWGKRQVRSTADIEIARCTEKAQDAPAERMEVLAEPSRPMIQAAARSGGVSEIEKINQDEVLGDDIVPQ